MSRYQWRKLVEGDSSERVIPAVLLASGQSVDGSGAAGLEDDTDPGAAAQDDFKRGYEEGLEQGRLAGLSELQEKTAQLTLDFQGAIQLLVDLRQDLVKSHAAQLAQDMGALFRGVFDHEISLCPELLEAVIDRAGVDISVPVRVEVSPVVYDRCVQLAFSCPVELVANANVAPGSIRLSNSDFAGLIDVPGNLDQLLNRISVADPEQHQQEPLDSLREESLQATGQERQVDSDE
ncbi:MAG: hypothetical protein AAF541_22580 [Pseudomonadota bacterium]